MARKNPVVQWLTTGTTIGFGKILGMLALKRSRWMGRQFGKLAYYTIPRVKRVGLANLERAFNQMPERERVALLKKSVENVGIVAGEFNCIPKITPEFVKRHVIIKGEQNVPRNRGAVVIGAHLGNWEWMAPVMAAMGHQVAEVVRPLDHPPLNRYIDRIRTAGNIMTVPKEATAVKLLSLLRKGYKVGILVDQAQRKNAAPTKFFGKKCWSTIGPVILALRANVPIIPASMTRNADGMYRLEFHQRIMLQHSEDWTRDLVVNTQRCQDAVEAIIRKYPEQWLWIHRRWEDKPKLQEEWALRLRLHEKEASDAAITPVDVSPAGPL